MYSSVGRSIGAAPAVAASANTAPTAAGNFHRYARMLCPPQIWLVGSPEPTNLVSQHRGVGSVHVDDAHLRLGPLLPRTDRGRQGFSALGVTSRRHRAAQHA